MELTVLNWSNIFLFAFGWGIYWGVYFYIGKIACYREIAFAIATIFTTTSAMLILPNFVAGNDIEGWICVILTIINFIFLLICYFYIAKDEEEKLEDAQDTLDIGDDV